MAQRGFTHGNLTGAFSTALGLPVVTSVLSLLRSYLQCEQKRLERSDFVPDYRI